MQSPPSAMPAMAPPLPPGGWTAQPSSPYPLQSLTPEQQQQQQQFLQWQQFQQWQVMQQSSVSATTNPYAAAAAPPAQPSQPPLPPFGASPQPLSPTQQQTANFATTATSEQQQQQPANATAAASPATTKESSSSSYRGGCDVLGGMTSLTTFLNTFNTNGTKLLASLSTSGKEVQQFLNITKTCGG
jgi:hypothetical protein